MSWLDWLGDYGVPMAGTAATIYGALDNADDTRALGGQIQGYLDQMGTDLNTGSQFQGYGVTSSLGNSTVGTDGSVSLGVGQYGNCLLYTSPSPRDKRQSRMPSSA